jgi:D-tyrosyl-tRNA(Tyr) deacylase
MRAVIQRVIEANVRINGEIKDAIGTGFMVLLGIEHDDTIDDIEWLSNKIVHMRIFSDSNGLMNLALNDVNGDILLISQFTLHSSTKKGNRPSFLQAAKPTIAIPLYEKMIAQLERDLGKKIGVGLFGADMKVALVNDGPITILIDSKNKQ